MRSRHVALTTLSAFVTLALAAGCSRSTPASNATLATAPAGSAAGATPLRDDGTRATGEEGSMGKEPARAERAADAPAAEPRSATTAHAAAPRRAGPAGSKDSHLAEAEEFGMIGLSAGSPVAGTGLGGGGRAAERSPAAPPPSLAVAPSAGSIRAGEWDDNANYREFTKYLAAQGDRRIHRLDVRDRRFLVVRDAAGMPVPRCRITVRDGERETTLTTVASGRAVLFPRAEGLRDANLVATASCGGQTARAAFALGQGDDGAVELKLAAKRELPETKVIDVGFILDTTSSMSEEIDSVKATIQKVASQLDVGGVRIRIGLVEYKDRGDEFVTKVYPMSPDTQGFARKVANLHASGGGDTPESMNEGLHAGMTRLDWSEDSVARFAFLIADAPPHLDYSQDFDYAAEMRDASHRGIQVFTIAASGMDDLGQSVFRQIAQYTGATNMFVLRGGAGPQSTGAGDPKTSCGGRHQSFESGNLDALIVGKIRHELRSMDRDPMRIAGLHQDENAKPCEQRVAWRD